jgi:hypothetical protein
MQEVIDNVPLASLTSLQFKQLDIANLFTADNSCVVV